MASIAHRAYSVLQEDGPIEFIKQSIKYLYENSIRSFLPTTGKIYYNGIPVREVKVLDSVIPGAHPGPEIPKYEEPLVDAIESHVEEGDTVVEIGGGNGVGTAYSAKTAGETGGVHCYEGTKTNLESVRKTIALNGLQDRVTLHHAVVGPDISLVGVRGSPDELHPSQLTDCDVLVLDCEGAEKAILSEMDVRPRKVIVETHGHKDSGSDKVEGVLGGHGYTKVSKNPASTIEDEKYGMATLKESKEFDNYIMVFEKDD